MKRNLFALFLAGFVISELYVGHIGAEYENSFANKVIIVTGASSGIGADAAIHLAKRGASVSLVGRNESRLNAVSEEIKSAGAPTPLVIVADVTKYAQRIIDETVNHFGKLDILINNAGIMTQDTAEDINMAVFDSVMNTNVRAVVELTKLAIPHLKKTKGNILNVSSVNSMRILENIYAYTISKIALSHLTRSAARSLGPKGIRVNALCPGMIRTPIFETSYGWTKEQADQFVDESYPLFPVGRAGNTSDTSNAIEYLVSEKASFITGIEFLVDGGTLVASVQR